MPSPSAESLAAPVETAAHPNDRAPSHPPDRSWYRFALRLLPEPRRAGRWIDLGCGQGEFLGRTGHQSSRGLGLDFWPENARAASRAGHPSLAADLNHPLPFRDASLDGVALIEVIEHIVRAEDLLGEIARVLRPGGWLLLTTPNAVHWTYRWRTLTGHPPKQEGYHYRFFTRDRLADKAAEQGFEIEARASYGKQALLSRLGRLAGRDRRDKVRYRVPGPLEGLLAQHFVWRMVKR